jgi:hypothetical protein
MQLVEKGSRHLISYVREHWMKVYSPYSLLPIFLEDFSKILASGRRVTSRSIEK